MKFLKPYYFEVDSVVSEESLLERLSTVGTVTENSFLIPPSEKFSVRGVAEVHGRLVTQKDRTIVHAHIRAPRSYRIGARIWIIVTLIIFLIALVNEIKFQYFHSGIFFIAAIGAIGHLTTVWLYKASVKANIAFLNEVMSGR